MTRAEQYRIEARVAAAEGSMKMAHYFTQLAKAEEMKR